MNDVEWYSAALFQGISPKEEAQVLRCLAAIEREYPKDALILQAGEQLSAMGLVLEGSVQILRENYWGDRQILSAVGKGQLFGESYALLPKVPLMVSVQAAEDARVLFLRVDRLLTPCGHACSFHSRLLHNLLAILAGKNLALTRKIDHVSKKTIREKVLAYLWDQAVLQNSRSFSIPFNRQQLADYLAVDRSALSAELSKMRRDGLIDCWKNHFTLT